MTPSPDHEIQLKHIIEQKEVEIQAELLKARKERAKLIDIARKKADLIFTEYQEEVHKRRDSWKKDLENRRNKIFMTLSQKEEEKLGLLEVQWEEKGTEILEKILEDILPDLTEKASRRT